MLLVGKIMRVWSKFSCPGHQHPNIRSVVTRSTGFTPYTLQPGLWVKLPIDITYGLLWSRGSSNLLWGVWGCCSLNSNESMWTLELTYMEHRSISKDCMMWAIHSKFSMWEIWCITKIHHWNLDRAKMCPFLQDPIWSQSSYPHTC